MKLTKYKFIFTVIFFFSKNVLNCKRSYEYGCIQIKMFNQRKTKWYLVCLMISGISQNYKCKTRDKLSDAYKSRFLVT